MQHMAESRPIYRPVLLCLLRAHCACVRACHGEYSWRASRTQLADRHQEQQEQQLDALLSISLSLFHPTLLFFSLFCSALLLLLSTVVVVFRPFRVLCVLLSIRCVLSVVQQSRTCLSPLRLFCFVLFFFLFKILRNWKTKFHQFFVLWSRRNNSGTCLPPS